MVVSFGSVPKQDIKLFIFRLIAWEILLPEYIIETKSIAFVAAKIQEPAMFLFQSIDAWNNIVMIVVRKYQL